MNFPLIRQPGADLEYPQEFERQLCDVQLSAATVRKWLTSDYWQVATSPLISTRATLHDGDAFLHLR